MKKPEIKNKNKNKEKHNSNNNNNDNYNNRRRREETPFGDRRRRPWRWRRRLISPAAAASRRLPKKKKNPKKIYIQKIQRWKRNKDTRNQIENPTHLLKMNWWRWIRIFRFLSTRPRTNVGDGERRRGEGGEGGDSWENSENPAGRRGPRFLEDGRSASSKKWNRAQANTW